MTNILIPTDLSPASLQLVKRAIDVVNLRKVNIVLFHAFAFPDNAFELIRSGYSRPYVNMLNEEFRQACKQLKEQYPQAIAKIFFKAMDGDTAAVFRNYIDANEIDMIICPEDYAFKPVHKLSVDPRPLFKKSGIKVSLLLEPQEEIQLVTTHMPVPAVALVPQG